MEGGVFRISDLDNPNDFLEGLHSLLKQELIHYRNNLDINCINSVFLIKKYPL